MFYDDPLREFHAAAIQQQPHKPLMVDINFGTLDPEVFENELKTINAIDDNNLTMFIIKYIGKIADDVTSNQANYSYLFRDTRFISCFIRAVSSIPQIEYKLKIASNKLAYDYFVSDNPNPQLKKQYLTLAQIVNRLEIARLIGLGVDETSACNFALCRYSSMSERTNVKRLNFSLYHKNPDIFTEQMVVDIYQKLFTSISDLFYGTMFETYSDQEMDMFQQSIGDAFSEMYGTIGLAVLDLLRDMPSESIRKVLLGYAEEWQTRSRLPVRFGLRSLSNDYNRITTMVEYLIANNVVIP
jgi:hypothetical protein